MTDEEKAEEYLKDTPPCYYSMIKRGYLDGLAEGRKATTEKISIVEKENKISEEIIIGEQQEINRLEKENAELKAQIEQLKYNLKCRDDELAESKAHCKAVDKVNEYMKCCENCKHDFECDDIELCDKWELA